MSKKIRKLLLKLAGGLKLSEVDHFYFEKFCHNLKNEIPFSFARYGDGEWAAILKSDGENCDGHQYFDDMGTSLSEIIGSPVDYYIGIQPLAIRAMLPRMGALAFPHQNSFFNADILHKASEYGIIHQFFAAMANRRIILVGPEYLRDQYVLQIAEHVLIPEKNCWLERDNTLAALHSTLTAENDVVLFCASMAANVYVDQMYTAYGKKHSFLDIGSLLDPFAGKLSRGYHRKLKIS